MKRFAATGLFAWLAVLLAAGCGKKIDYTKAKLEEIYRPYDIKSGIIKYKYSGDMEGIQELYFDDYGWKQVIYYEKTPAHGTKMTLKGLDIIMPDYIISINMNKMEGSKRPNLMFLTLKQIWDMTPANERLTLGPKIEKFSKQMNLGLAYRDYLVNMTEESGVRKTVAGKQCEVYKLMNGDMRLFVWKKIVLGTEFLSPQGKTIIMDATEVKDNVPIPPEKYNVPVGATIKEYTMDSLYVRNERIFITQLLSHYLGLAEF
ncbi:MAG: hypothetical protein ABIM46_07040 [candidate division WOR-3 bacterium]